MKKTKKIIAALLAAVVCISATYAEAAVNTETQTGESVLQEDQGTGWDGVTTEKIYEEKITKLYLLLRNTGKADTMPV